MARRQYPFHLIEPKWQQHWDVEQTFRAWNPGETLPDSHPFSVRHQLGGRAPVAAELPPKYYILDMFPYPSGAGLHVGHPEGYTATDILARYRRSTGLNVLHPMGWDAFGLPAEQYAIRTGQHPRVTTEANIATFKRQIRSLGFSYDWTREVDTTDPAYFRWTQWIFLQLYNAWFNPTTNRAEPIATLEYPAGCDGEAARRAWRDGRRLAFVSEAPVWWCEALGTVLANEEVVDGLSEVGGHPVVRRPMRQWMLRITSFAERLLWDLDTIQWSDSLKEMQRNWIGRSEGAEVGFKVPEAGLSIMVFTTRPDTLFGATYMVLAPEHRFVSVLTTPAQQAAVETYRTTVAQKSDLERTELAKDKTGVFTGAYAVNPVNGERIPIWIADYVLATYGTGAIMAVPAHDTRDFEFATQFELPVVQVVQPPAGVEWRAFVGEGVSVNSSGPEISLDGLPTTEAKRRIIDWLGARGLGRRTINYKLRDWLFSRQRYWGEPFPILWRTDAEGRPCHEGLPDGALPLRPPALDDYKPTPDGRPPLARATDWVALSDGATRELNTMPQWAGSCWYYLRYLDSRNADRHVGADAERYWMGEAGRGNGGVGRLAPAPGVDLYVGGTEHAVLHLLYARFWHKVLFDLGHVTTPEPFFKLVNQGLILGETEFTFFSKSGSDPIDYISVERLDIVSSGGVLFGQLKERKPHKDDVIIGTRITDESQVEKRGDSFVLRSNPEIKVDSRSCKMSKSRGNVVNPDDILTEYGADAFRLYEMFMGPLQDSKPWNTKGVEGVYRFLGRVWRLFVDDASEAEFEQACTTTEAGGQGGLLGRIRLSAALTEDAPSPAQSKVLHACIRKVTEDLEALRFNTAISAMMVFVNEANAWETKPVSILRTFLQLLAPFAPHVAEELWDKLHRHVNRPAPSLTYERWPEHDPALLVEDVLEIPVQVNGKFRDVIRVAATASQAELEAAARSSEKVIPFLAGKTIRKVIVVPKKMVNLVVG